MVFRMNVSYILILLATVLFIGIIVSTIVSYQLYKNTKTEVRHIENLLVLTAKKKHPDWDSAINNVIYENHPNVYVHIETPDGKTIYSDGSESIRDKEHSMAQAKGFFPFLLKSDTMPVYYDRISYRHYTFKIYAKMAAVHEFMESMVRVLFFSLLAGALIGSFVIYKLSRRLSKPLTDLTSMIKSLTAENLQFNVAVPKGPAEVKDLAIAFNHLMDRLNQQVQREKDFVSDASHELRTPLAAIHGHVNLILRRGKDHPEVIERSARFINEESKRMQRLIDQLLMAAKLDQPAAAGETANLSIIAKNISEDFKPVIRQKFTSEIEEDVVAAISEDHFHSIIVSLLDNAGKYTPKDGWVRLEVRRKGEACIVSVQNSGPAIPDEEKEKIFERFYRIDKSRNSKIGGTGLGLAIVKQLVEINGGEIRVSDLEPSGCSFTVKLKAAVRQGKD